MNAGQEVILSMEGPIARITFNRPEVLNAVNVNVATGLLAAFQSIAENPTVRVVVMNGNGKAFMAGGDVANFELSPERAPAEFTKLLDPFHEAMRIMMGLAQPVIASVHGAAAGAGLSLALAADIVIAASDTRFTTGYAKLGVSPDGSVSWSLPRLVGLRRALEMALFSDVHTADEMMQLGLINRAVPAAELEQETEAVAKRLATGPTIAFGKIKSLMRQSLDRSLAEQLDAEAKALLECVVTGDFPEGVTGFLEKRPAKFQGK